MVNYPYKRQIKTATRKRYGSKKKGYKYKQMVNDGAKVASLVSMGKDIMTLKRALNTEKKKANHYNSGTSFGLTYDGSGGAGYYAAYLHPTITQGIASNQRIGNSVKIVSAMFQAQVTPQENANHDDISFKWYIINKADANQITTPVSMTTQFLNPNPFSEQIDTFSNRDPEFFNAYKIIASGAGKLKMSETDSSTKLPTKNIQQPLRLSLHQKFNNDGSTTTTKNQLYLLFVADSGDSADAYKTGCSLKWTMDYYYVDN